MLNFKISNKYRSESNWRKKKKIFLVFVLLIAVAGGVFAYKVIKNGGGIEGTLITVLNHDENTVATLPKVYCVLLGQSQNLTDTIMLASYDPKTQKASLLSIPRDTFVGTNKNNAQTTDKINALCQYTHPEKTVKAVSEITGIDVTNYILVDTEALVDIVDLIGGVWFDVPIDMKYTDKKQNLYINLKAGYQLLDGKQAEGLVRFRHNQDGTTYPAEYGEQDIGRTRTQREFLTELAKQTFTMKNLFKIGDLIDIAYKDVKTNMSVSEMKDYIPYIIKFDTDNLKTGILPGTNELCNKLYIYIHDKEETKEIVDELFNNDDETIDSNDTENKTSSSVKVEVLNGSSQSKALSDVTEKLKEKGYNVVKASPTTQTAKTTIIKRNDVSKDIEDELKKLVGVSTIQTAEQSEDADITIIIGKDY